MRAKRVEAWRKWSQQRAARAKKNREVKVVVRSDEQAIDVIEHIAAICGRAGLPNAQAWLMACARYERGKASDARLTDLESGKADGSA